MSPLRYLLACAVCAVVPAGCNGAVAVDPIGAPAAEPSDPTKTANDASQGSQSVVPQPVGPYTASVATTDVSILYPLPLAGGAMAFVRPTDAGVQGELLSRKTFETVVASGSLDQRNDSPSTYDALRVVSIRLDPCGKRKIDTCTSEVRLVFQAIFETGVGAAATDGALHVSYDVAGAELVTMTKQILTLKQANGDVGSNELSPHPILAAQGLGGPFASGLRAIVLEHLGDVRASRVTFFDHRFPDEDSWTFRIFDRVGSSLIESTISGTDGTEQTITGVNAIGGSGLLDQNNANASAFPPSSGADKVDPLVIGSRPGVGTPEAANLEPSFAAALRIEDPTVHSIASIDCANCHLAEGARLIGESVYGFDASASFTHPRGTSRKDERRSITNLHAFGYLERQVSIMQRTANESTLVAERMEALVQ